MKIAYLSTFYPFRGGIAQFNAALYRVFEKKHDISAFTFTRQYPNFLFPGTSQMVGEGDTADKIQSIRALDTINPLTYGGTGRKILKFGPDMMLTKFWMPFFGPSLGRVAKLLLKKGVINISILDNVIPHEKRPGDMAFTKYFLNNNHGFVVMSEAVKQALLSLKPGARYLYHPHPLYDHFGKKTGRGEALKKFGIPGNCKLLLFFGFIRDYKGLDLLLEAMKELPEDYRLIIAGEVYGKFDKYDRMISDLGLESRVTSLVRYISDDEVPAIFSAADACVLPYKSATQSGIVGIAYHFGLPVIATDVGGLREMIEPYDTGMMIEKPEAPAIRDTITKYFTPGLREKFIDNIRAYKEKYNWQSLADGIIDLYRNLKQG